MAQGVEKHKNEIVQLVKKLDCSTSNYERQLDEKEIAIKFYKVYMRLAYMFLHQFVTE